VITLPQETYDTYNNGTFFEDAEITLSAGAYYDVYDNGLNFQDGTISLLSAGGYYDFRNNGLNFQDAIINVTAPEYFVSLNSMMQLFPLIMLSMMFQLIFLILPGKKRKEKKKPEEEVEKGEYVFKLVKVGGET